MKRLFTVMIIGTVLGCFAGCAKKKTLATGDTSGKIRVCATIFPLYDFSRAISGGRASLTMLLPPAAESHSFEPTPQDIITIKNSNVFLYIGGESEAWVRRILESMDTSNIIALSLMDAVSAVEEELVEGMEAADDGLDAAEGGLEYDEHIWTSPKNAARMVKAIAAALVEADAANAAWYRSHATSYTSLLSELDALFQAEVNGAKRKTLVFADRFPFRYFADEYGLSYFAAFPGCATETEPSAQTVAFLINKVKAERIPVVFYIELSNEKMADTISEETGAKKELLHSAHNLSKKDFESGVTYIDIMRANVPRLEAALR